MNPIYNGYYIFIDVSRELATPCSKLSKLQAPIRDPLKATHLVFGIIATNIRN